MTRSRGLPTSTPSAKRFGRRDARPPHRFAAASPSCGGLEAHVPRWNVASVWQLSDCHLNRASPDSRNMSESTKAIASGAVREIEPELRELFTKVVERDPREAVKMLEPYPDEFVVQM